MRQPIIDTHAHLDGPEYADDLPDVIQRARDAGVRHILIPAVNWTDFPHLLHTCQQFPNYLHPMLGLHPEEVNPTKINIPDTLNQMEAWLEANATTPIAIGEIGLDYYWDTTYAGDQINVLLQQTQWALRHSLPLMIHCRKAQQALVDTLQPYATQLTGVFHCFTGSPEQACQLLNTFPQFALGIGGAITFKNAHLPQTLVQCVPLTRIVIETDAPYLTPVPHRGQRNESAYTTLIVRKLAETYHLSDDQIARQTTLNAQRIFTFLQK